MRDWLCDRVGEIEAVRVSDWEGDSVMLGVWVPEGVSELVRVRVWERETDCVGDCDPVEV